MSKMVYLPYVHFEQEEEAEVSAGTLRSILPKQEKVEAGMEQSSCRTVSIRLRMLDTAQVEYRKLSEVHLQCRVDDNQPE